MPVIGGILLHAVGASCASLCYTPQKKVVHWSWQTYWLAQASICWFLLPMVVAWFTIPDLGLVLQEIPSAAMWKTFLLGMAYGIGGTAFGMAIRYVGFSLTYAIAVGISCVLGTLLPPLLHGTLASILGQQGAGWVIAGIGIGALGIALCGVAGRFKELDLASQEEKSTFSLAKGLPLCFLAGVLSAFYGFAIDQGQPMAEIAARYGAGHYQANVIYIFSNTGAFVSTLIYCLYLHKKENTFKEYIAGFQTGNSPFLSLNFLMALITGCLWYAQFFFYGLGHVRMGDYKFSSWGIHMIMLVLFSSFAGLIMKEWIACRKRTIRMLIFSLAVLIAAVLVLTYGNYLGSE